VREPFQERREPIHGGFAQTSPSFEQFATILKSPHPAEAPQLRWSVHVSCVLPSVGPAASGEQVMNIALCFTLPRTRCETVGGIVHEPPDVSCGGSVRGRPVQDRRKQGCLREATMDGFTAFLDRPPPRRTSANHHPHPFMNNARDLRSFRDAPFFCLRGQHCFLAMRYAMLPAAFPR
jgi:hypothetical protein